MFVGILLWTWAGSLVLYAFEHGENEYVKTYADAFMLSADIVTSAGFGDAYPMTVEGRLAGFFLLFTGTVMIWSYVAVFAAELCRVVQDSAPESTQDQ